MKVNFYYETTNLNRYLLADLQNRLGVNNLLCWLEGEAERLADLGLISSGHVTFTKSLLHVRKIEKIFEDDIPSDAYIKPSHGEYYNIIYNRRPQLFRRRFSIAHEIGHTYWFAPGGGGKPLSPIQRSLGSDPSIENLCDRFAAALLLPKRKVLNFINQLLQADDRTDIPLHIIPAISSKFCVAEKAVARRIYFNTPVQLCAIVCLRLIASSSGANLPEEATRAQQWVTSWHALPDHVSEQESVPGFSIPLTTNGRHIPADMVPDLTNGGTNILALDGRWWYGLKLLPVKESKIPLRQFPATDSRVAYASRVGDRMYIAFPSKNPG